MKMKGPFVKITMQNEVVKHPLFKSKFKIETFRDSI